uniref:Uncharacterized protein n=1 Tax=Candidatus Phytoplasma australasiaticum subsp. australasiaticum TaxID=2832407 RepID=A0A7S7G0N2_9MOLU|nr:hypothetical protein H7685_02815 ['Parthenium hysterophorus' phyllody phytoplasma]
MENIETQFAGITLFWILFILLTILLAYFFYKWGYFAGLIIRVFFSFNFIFLTVFSGIIFVFIGYQVGIIKK